MDLRPYASTPTQKAVAKYLHAHPDDQGKWAKIGRAIGKDRDNTQKTFKRLEKKAARSDPGAHRERAPEGYVLGGVSTLRHNEHGELQWVKTKQAKDDPQALLMAFQEALDSTKLRAARPVRPPKDTTKDLLAVYPLGDPHLGLIASALDTGTDYNTEQCVRDLTRAVGQLVYLAPAADEALIINAGDFAHADDMSGSTFRSGHKLDVDPRWAYVAQRCTETLITLVDTALTKHKRVTIDNRVGNHDDHTSWWLALCLQAHYRNEPRVTVTCDPSVFWHMEFGKCLIASTHGHTACKVQDLGSIMAHDWKHAWARTEHRKWYVGHFHHKEVTAKDVVGCEVEKLRVMGAQDAWSRGKFRSRRGLFVDTWHRERGCVSRHEVGLADLR